MPRAGDTYWISADSTSFSCIATTNLEDDDTSDTWSINQGVLTNIVNDSAS